MRNSIEKESRNTSPELKEIVEDVESLLKDLKELKKMDNFPVEAQEILLDIKSLTDDISSLSNTRTLTDSKSQIFARSDKYRKPKNGKNVPPKPHSHGEGSFRERQAE